jgi:hypothetical protein
MSVTIRDSERPITGRQLSRVEKQLGITLPEPYRRFLVRHNGGRPRPGTFQFGPVSEPYSGSVVDWFLAVYEGEHNNFEHYFHTYKLNERRLPENLVPIAHDPGGNLICISVSGKDVGAVYFWDHEREEGPPGEAVSLIATSFDDFLAGLGREEGPRAAPGPRDPFAACEYGDVNALKQLLGQGGSVETENEYGRTLMEEAAMYGHVEVLRLLIRRGAALADALEYAVKNGNVEAAEYLLSEGANVNGQQGDGGPLHEATLSGQATSVELLLAHGADVNARPKRAPTALELAKKGGHDRIVRMLKKANKQ